MHDGDDVYVTRVFETIHVTLRGRVFFKFFSSRCVRVVSVLTELKGFFLLALCQWGFCFGVDEVFYSCYVRIVSVFTDFLLTLCEGCFSVNGIFSSHCVRVVSVLTDFSPHIVGVSGRC